MARISEFPPYLPDRFIDIPLDGGRVQSITVNPSNNDHWIVSTEFGGLWKTEDRGRYWFHLNDLAAVFSKDVAYAPDGETVIASVYRDTQVVNGGGIWVSRDGGYTWAKPASANPPAHARIPTRTSAYGISYAPDDARKVFVGTDYGVAVSRNNGSTWQHYMVETTSPVAGDLLQNQALPILALPGGVVLAGTPTGIYRSVNNGRDWRSIRAGNFSSSFKLMDVSPVDSEVAFILQDYNTLFRYVDSTGAWTTIPLPGGRSRGPFVRVSRDPDSDSIVLWVGAGVILLRLARRNTDRYDTITAGDWMLLHRAAGLHDDSGYLGLDNARRPVLYGSDGGLFKPTNTEATTWTSAAVARSGWNSYQITSLAGTNVRPTGTGRGHTDLYFATQDNALWASSDGGTTWPTYDCAEGFHLQAPIDATLDSEITAAYGRIGCPGSNNRFSDAHFERQRDVSDLDISGATLTGFNQAFYISPNNWVRLRALPTGVREIYISQDNGLRWRRKATVHLQDRGVFTVAGPAANPTIYIPFLGALRAPGGRERIGLIKLTNVFSAGEVNLTDRLIYLPTEGSLGVRATMFDHQAVFGVDPRNAEYIIAPDINNHVVKVSTNGGRTWRTDSSLTNAVKQRGRFLLYDDSAYHLQILRFGFDPYSPDHILVGTRDAGVFESRDGGGSWEGIEGSEPISYITGFFFQRDGIVIVSSYGRGLWKLDFRIVFGPFPFEYYCLGDCIIRFPPDPREQPEIRKWWDKDVIVFFDGSINGLVLSGRQVKQITVTPGAFYRRYVGKTKNVREIDIVESEKGAGFGNLKGCLAALENGEVIKAIILQENKIMGIISGKEPFSNAPEPEPSQPAPRASKSKAGKAQSASRPPYLMLTGAIPAMGATLVGEEGTIHVYATGFKFDAKRFNLPLVLLDGQVVDKAPKVRKDGVVETVLQIPRELANGQHAVRVTQTWRGKKLAAEGSFVKVEIDEFGSEK